MSAIGVRRSEAGGAVGSPVLEQYNDIAEAATPQRGRAVLRVDLAPWQEAASLSPDAAQGEAALARLTRFLGAPLTVASPAWSRDPLPGLRALQKSLVAHSLTLDQGERADSMGAIGVVERAVRLRLRWQQMELGSEPLEGAGGAAGAA
jgi:hypothetical protein